MLDTRPRHAKIHIYTSWRILLAMLLPMLAACSVATAPDQTNLGGITPVAMPTLFPSPTAVAPPVAVAPPEDPGERQEPALSDEPSWSFVVTGDTWKDTPVLRRILSDAAQHGDEFIVVCGDITPQGRPEQFEEFAGVVATVSVPVYVAPGNHDSAWSGSLDYFEQYYPRHQSFDHRNLHVTIADNASHSFTAGELQWLEDDLAASAQPLKMVFVHVPPIMPYPVPGEDTLQGGGDELMALLEQHGVDALFAGHLQAYARMEHNGVIYTITGGGGSPLHVPAFLGGRYHYVRVTVQGDTATQEVVWLDDVATPTP